METFLPYFLTGIISFFVGLSLKFIEFKSRIVFWRPHEFLFEVPIEGQDQRVFIYTRSITIHNIGRKGTDNIDIAHKQKPDYFKLDPAIDYQEVITPSGEHIIRIPHLASKDYFTIEFLSYKTLPVFLYVRSKDGDAKFIRLTPQRNLPKSVKAIAAIIYLVGFSFILYWLIRALIFLYKLYFS